MQNIRVHSTKLFHAPNVFSWAMRSTDAPWKVQFLIELFNGKISFNEAYKIVGDPSIVRVNRADGWIEYTAP